MGVCISNVDPWGDGSFYLTNYENGSDWHLAERDTATVMDSNVTEPQPGQKFPWATISAIDDEAYYMVNKTPPQHQHEPHHPPLISHPRTLPRPHQLQCPVPAASAPPLKQQSAAPSAPSPSSLSSPSLSSASASGGDSAAENHKRRTSPHTRTTRCMRNGMRTSQRIRSLRFLGNAGIGYGE
ncbi:hypothetical protein K458DRAFT_209728 [Lentithecium fluviatile CBS 122367]|uniref:Uncharacterized protein n=1 Tax=Lentithecium fluviatile CBS 122367 TaxID=1168545 RepID=A0A6G1J7T4_9PLEO|nr:hypothetical protein K458DRAFT_209728 [Lentithecium fluviatile CBS 122367]